MRDLVRTSSLPCWRKTTVRPQLSIGLPVYNGEKFLASVFDCFAAQTFRDYELIVCDNASTDRTSEICEQYAEKDQRIRAYRNERNLGAIGNYNRVYALSSATPFFKWAASDDLCEPTYLETCIRTLDENPDVVLAHTGTVFIDSSGSEFPLDRQSGHYLDPITGVRRAPDSTKIGDSGRAVRRFWQVLSDAQWGTHMFGVIRRPALAETGLLRNFPSSDRLLLSELALLGRFKASPERLFQKRFHENVSWALTDRDLKQYLATADHSYSRRSRQLKAYFSVAHGKPIGPLSKTACAAMVAAHCIKTVVSTANGKGSAEAAEGKLWRQRSNVRSSSN